MTNSPASVFVRIIVIVSEEFAEINSKILIYFAQTLEILKISEEIIFIAGELEALESIVEEVKSLISNMIGRVCVDKESKLIEIKEVVDNRYFGPSRQTFYLVKTIEGDYYWFHVPRTERDWKLQQLIGDYRHKSHVEVGNRGMDGVRKLCSGKIVSD